MLASRSTMASDSSANAGSNALSGKAASPWTLSRADSRKEDREEGRSGVVGRDVRVWEVERFRDRVCPSLEAIVMGDRPDTFWFVWRCEREKKIDVCRGEKIAGNPGSVWSICYDAAHESYHLPYHATGGRDLHLCPAKSRDKPMTASGLGPGRSGRDCPRTPLRDTQVRGTYLIRHLLAHIHCRIFAIFHVPELIDVCKSQSPQFHCDHNRLVVKSTSLIALLLGSRTWHFRCTRVGKPYNPNRR